MRLTGGEARGRRLVSPRGTGTRPTSDRIRENLFNILGPLDGLRVLDLFCGAGTLGLEALSRGAREAWFVDASPLPLRALEASVVRLGFQGRVHVVRARLPGWLGRIHDHAGRFDLIMLDPPYGAPELQACLQILGRGNLLGEAGRVVAEHDRAQPIEPAYGALCRVDIRRYGRTVLSFYDRCNE